MIATNSLFAVPTRNRPTQHDDAVVDAAVTTFIEFVRRQLHGFEDLDTEDAETRRQVRDAITMHLDGYEIARELEDVGWEVDAEFVDMVDVWWVSDALRSATAAWVTEQGIRPSLKVGDRVLVTRGTIRSHPVEAVGAIIRIDEAQAQYIVNVPEHGQSEKSGWVLDYEVVEALERVEAG